MINEIEASCVVLDFWGNPSAEQYAAALTFVDGLKMLNPGQTEGLVDGVHCNSLGFFFNAHGLEPFLRKALREAPRIRTASYQSAL